MSAGAPEKFPIQVLQSWGVASARHTSGGVVPSNTLPSQGTEFLFDAPIGPSIVRWDIAKQHRVSGQYFQAHRDLVTCMRRSPSGRYVVTSCYSGGVRLWKGEGWELLDKTEAPMASQHHVCLSCVLTGASVLLPRAFFPSLVPRPPQAFCRSFGHKSGRFWYVRLRQVDTNVTSVNQTVKLPKHRARTVLIDG